MKITIQQIGRRFEDCIIAGNSASLQNISKFKLQRVYDEKFLTSGGHFESAEASLNCTFSPEKKALLIAGKFSGLVIHKSHRSLQIK